MTYIGIDVGAKGAMAIINDNAHSISIVPYDKVEYINRLKENTDARVVIVERVNAMPHQGVVSMFSFGETFGWLQGVLDALGIPYELVTPQRWKKEFGVTSDKNTSIEVAHRLYPNIDLRRTQKSRKDDDNIAECILMAEWGRIKYK